MNRAEFQLGAMIPAGWRVFTDHFLLLFLGHLLVNMIIGSGPGAFVAGPFWFGLSAVALQAARGLPATIDDLFSGFRRFVPTLVVGLLMLAMVTVAGLAIAVPTLLLAMAAFAAGSTPLFSITLSVGLTLSLLPVCAVLFLYSPAYFILFDGETDALRAMQASRRMVWANAGQWLNVWVALSLLHVAGLLLCCVGVYLVTPWMVVVLAMAYEQEKKVSERAGDA